MREVSCLAIDVQGLAKLLGRIPSSQVSDYIAECMRALEESCVTYGGTVINRHSAGLTSIFGAPVAREREVELAIRAAFAARERVADISERLYAACGQNLATRYAVDFGLVRVGAYAAGADYVALGPSVENAARLRNNARPGTVLLSAAAADQVRPLFKMKPVALGATAADGRAESGFLVEGLSDTLVEGAVGARVFVGRRDELEELRRALAALRSGRGAAIGISGGPGIGKTRLLAEALAGEEGIRVYTGRCLPLTVGVSYAAFRAPLCAALESFPGATPLERAGNLIKDKRPELAEAVPLLGFILETQPLETPVTEQLRGVARFEKLYELVETILARVAEEGPTALVLEDAQWASNADFLLLSRLAEQVATLPLLLLITARERKSLSRVTADLIHLPPLDEGDVVELVRGLIPRERLSAELLRRIVGWARGSPLYCEEVAAAVAGGGEGEAFRPPASIKAAARARADKLSAGALALAKVVACVGLEAELELVREVTPAELRESLDELVAELGEQGILTLAEGRLAFVHDVIGNVLYESLVAKERAATLADIARAAESRGAEPGVVAHYLLAAGRSREAVEYLKEAGDRATAAYALLEAISHYQRALENLRGVGPADVGLKLELIEKLASSLLDYADHKRALALIEEELKYAETPSIRAKLLFLAGRAYAELSENRKALLYLEDAGKVYDMLNDPFMEGKTLQHMVKVLSFLGKAGERRRALAEALARYTEAGDDVGVAYCFNIIGTDYVNADEPARALEYFREGLYIWQEADDLPGQAIALTNLGFGYYLLGRYHEAVEFAERALEITRRVGSRRTQAAAVCNLVAYHLYLNPTKAEEYGREAVSLAAQIHNYEVLAGSHINLGELERCRGRWDAARQHVAMAAEAAAKIESPPYVFYSGLLGAKVELDAGEYESEKFRRHYEAVFKVEPPSRQTAALVRANLDADLALARKDTRRAAELVGELKGRVAAAKKAEEIHEGHLRLGELNLFLGDAPAAAAEFEWVMQQTEGVNFLHWPRAAFGLAQTCLTLGRRDDARQNLARAEEVFRKYDWLLWTDRVAQFRTEAEL